MNDLERVVVFRCDDEQLLGVLHVPDGPSRSTGVLIAVGGPQYRVGSHRQFVQIARALAGAGYPVFRFDYRGMGDSDGEVRTFESVDDDIAAAADAFVEAAGLEDGVVLLGLCDAASASLMYGWRDARVKGQILFNPWARTAEGEARSYVRHYYLQRLMQGSFWRKVFSGEFRLVESVSDFIRSLLMARRTSGRDDSAADAGCFLDRMLQGAERFQGAVLTLTSEDDLTAQEFLGLAQHNPRWRQVMERERCSLHPMPGADHTMSNRHHVDSAVQVCVQWLDREFGAPNHPR